ncbi:Peptidyl-prolyl cis-trans isomerase PpiD [uncultured Candidatus Thioglobus sp.]|nr:Peptidyl-prolyl cis-trans isomerase PpiD [uncultured Candidatus Thioglobus sp.]
MLSSIKDKIKGWVAYLVVGLITVPFALFGISEYFTRAANVVVASIDGEDISKEAFLLEFNYTKRRLQQELGEKYTAELNSMLKLSTIQSMVDRRMLTQLADKLGYAITRIELQAFIQANDVFKKDGKFSMEQYKQILSLNGYLDIEYERLQAKELMQNQIKYNFLDSAFIAPSMLKRLQSLNDQQRKFSYIQLDVADYANKTEVEAKSIKEFYETKKQLFFEPEQVKVDFVELSFKEIAKGIKVNDDDLFNFYEDEKQRFSTEEERQAQHILVESEELASTIVTQLKQGEDFAKLAAEHSQDAGSKDKGGDLGFFTVGVMVPEFEVKAFAMKEGEVSSPVKTDFGYHIIKLNKIKAETTKPFESVRDELTKLYTEQTVQKSIYKLTEQLGNLAYEASLEEVADQMDLKLQTSEFFAQDTKAHNAKFVAAAYSEEVLNKGENSTMIELSKDKFVVLRIDSKVAQRQKTFDEVKSEINQHLASLLAKTFIDNIVNNIANSFASGDTNAAQAFMDKNQLTWKEVDWVTRGSKQADIEIISRVFALSKPNDDATYDAYSLDDQRVVALKLSAVKTPSNAVNSTLPKAILSLESEEMFKSILATLRKNADIEIFEDRL